MVFRSYLLLGAAAFAVSRPTLAASTNPQPHGRVAPKQEKGVKQEEIDTLMGSASEASRSGDFEKLFKIARQVRDRLLDDQGGSAERLMALGWARFYEMKALFQLGKFAEAYEVWNRKEPIPFALNDKNLAWMSSVAAELAMRLDKPPEEIRKWGDQACTLRTTLKDTEGLLMCQQTLSALLIEKYPDQAVPYARELWRLGEDEDEMKYASRGIGYLLRAHEAKPTAASRAALIEVRTALQGKEAAKHAESGTSKVLATLDKALSPRSDAPAKRVEEKGLWEGIKRWWNGG
jgi:hypothetical protein